MQAVTWLTISGAFVLGVVLTLLGSIKLELGRRLGIGDTRREYNNQLARGKVRFAPDTLKDIPKDPEFTIRNLRARKLYLDAKTAIRDHNIQGAHLALKMADSLEPGNAAILELLGEVQGTKR